MTKLLAGTAAAAIALALSPATAQPAPPTPPGVAQGTAPAPFASPHVPPVIRSPVQVRAVTLQHEMTRDQVVQHVRSLFTHLDSNRDGFITRDEVAALHVRMMGMHNAMARGMAGVRTAMDHSRMRMDPGAMFDRLDTNHDGTITRQEFMAGHKRMEEHRVMIMRGGDGGHAMAGMDGMRMPMPGMGPMGPNGRGEGMANRLFGMADANRDGRVSLQEAETAALAHFDRIDRNRDGRVTPDERRQSHPMRDRRPG